MSKIIAFTGQAGSGKTTAAGFLVEIGYSRISFAQPIKDMIAAVWPQCKDKNQEYAELGGHTLRHAYQTLGTEWGRQLMDPDIWARQLVRSLRPGGLYVVDDLRYDNEAWILKSAGATIVEIYRPGLERMNHSSEDGVSRELIDTIMHNGLDTEILGHQVRRLANEA